MAALNPIQYREDGLRKERRKRKVIERDIGELRDEVERLRKEVEEKVARGGGA